MDRAAPRTWRLGLAGGALVAVVALVSRGSLFHDSRHNDGLGRAAVYVLAALIAFVLLAGLVLTVAGMRGGSIRRPPRRSFWRTILLTLFIIGALAVASPLIRRGSAQRSVNPPPATFTIVTSDCRGPCDGSVQSPGSSPWWIVIAAGVLVGALLVVGARASKGADGQGATPDRENALSLFDASLDDLLAERDPRRAITMAYGRLLDGLASCGLARADAETPYEHLSRALVALDVEPEALFRVTSLFSEARFSDHVLTSVHKERAIDAFRAARDSLAPLVERARS